MKIVLIILGVLVAFIVLNFINLLMKNKIAPKNLGVHAGKLAAMPKSPNAVSTQSMETEKKVEPLEFKGTINETKNIIEEILKNYQGAEIIRDEKDYIYAIFTTKTMKYKDDVEFYFDDEDKKVEFRSASRVGYSDMGMNRKRYEEISKLYYGK